MRGKLIGLVVLALVMGIPALADDTAEKSANAKASPRKEVPKNNEEARNHKVSSGEGSPLELELQQLRELLLQQSRELEAQRTLLHEQQRRMEAMEQQLNTSAGSPGASSESGGADPTTLATRVSAVASAQEELGAKVGRVEKEMSETKKSLEGKLRSFGPFSFSGDFRLRDEPFLGGPSNQLQVRNRERFRLRFNANVKLNDDISGGFSVASGDINDPISTNQTTNQFYTRKPFLIDRAFINYNPHVFKPLTLTGGKFAYPSYRTELTWDNDLNPEGLAQTLAFDINKGILKRVALIGFELPFTEVANTPLTNRSIVQSVVYGGQVQTIWQLFSGLKFSAYGAFYNYHKADPIAVALAAASSSNPQSPANGLLALGGSSVQNSVYKVGGAASTAQFASRFGLVDAIARFDVKTPYERWPIIILGDYVQNTRACANVDAILALHPTATPNVPCKPRERRGYWLEARYGRTQEKGDLQFAYTRMFIEREAVMGAFNFSDLRQASNVSQHRVEVFYQAYKNIQLAFTGLFGRPLNFGSSTPPENILKRLQFDVIYKF